MSNTINYSPEDFTSQIELLDNINSLNDDNFANIELAYENAKSLLLCTKSISTATDDLKISIISTLNNTFQDKLQIYLKMIENNLETEPFPFKEWFKIYRSINEPIPPSKTIIKDILNGIQEKQLFEENLSELTEAINILISKSEKFTYFELIIKNTNFKNLYPDNTNQKIINIFLKGNAKNIDDTSTYTNKTYSKSNLFNDFFIYCEYSKNKDLSDLCFEKTKDNTEMQIHFLAEATRNLKNPTMPLYNSKEKKINYEQIIKIIEQKYDNNINLISGLLDILISRTPENKKEEIIFEMQKIKSTLLKNSLEKTLPKYKNQIIRKKI
jgi:hypothetical protein